MINFIFGAQGHGKTTHILDLLRKDAEYAKPCLLIVPEQEAVTAERKTLEALPPKAQLTLEVLNFSRLYNRVCREYGGLSYSYVTKPQRHALMWRALRETAPLLNHYGQNATTDSAFVGTMLSTVSELKTSAVTIDALEEAAKECEDTAPLLSARLRDISLICGTYDLLVSEKYSDSSDDLSRLCDILNGHDFFAGYNVYIDSFTSFTSAEHRVIEKIFKGADNTFITVPLPSHDYSDISTASTEQSLKRLKRDASRWGGWKAVTLMDKRLGFATPLSYLSDNIWHLSEIPNDEKPSCEGSIVMEICDNAYAEADATASHVLELLRSGARCRDIVIIMRDSSKYRGIIDGALEKAGIPYFFSEKTDMCALAPVKLILTAIRIRQYGWRKGDVIAHVKTGLCGFDMEDIDLFEDYVNTWNISGTRITDGEWTMNPDGYTDRLNDRGQRILKSANSVRERLCDSLGEFFVLLDAAETISDMCRAVYTYVEKISLRTRTEELAFRELSFGNKKTASELSGVYDVILKSLADVGEALEKTPASIDDFYNVLHMVFEQTEIGTIPTSIDEVTVGSASLLRASDPDYVFALGLCEGEFPATVNDTGLLGSHDRDVLSELGIDLGANEDVRSSDELMFVKNTFSAPRKKLYLLTHTADSRGVASSPSLPFRRTENLFSDLKAHRFRGNELSYLCGSPSSVAAQLRNIDSPSDRAAATLAVSEHLPLVATMSDTSTSTDTCRVSPSVVKGLIGDKIYISPSSLEKYVKCPFGYFAGHMLSLRETKKGSFSANNVGDFVHYVMEHIISFAIPDGENDSVPTDEEIAVRVGEIVNEYVTRIVPEYLRNTKRIQHLCAKLQRLSLLVAESVVKEFSDSDFRPAFFELHIDGRDGNPAPLKISLDGGASLILKGYIDRVDVWRDKDKTYVRIVDYKTGSKKFDLSELEIGLNTQMLLYLFAICRSPNTSLVKKNDNGDKDMLPIPAGVVYLSSAFPKISLDDFVKSDEDIMSLAYDELTRSGLILDDEQVINAMSHKGSADILLGISKKDGKYTGKSLISDSAFCNLFDSVTDTLTQIGNEIYNGIADCSPLVSEDPCRYCKVAPMCRKTVSSERRTR